MFYGNLMGLLVTTDSILLLLLFFLNYDLITICTARTTNAFYPLIKLFKKKNQIIGRYKNL